MATGRMHMSRPAALRFLAALRRHGWQATTWEIARATGSLNVHCDCSSARMLLEQFGLDGRAELTCQFAETTEAGRRIYIYRLRPRAAELARRLLADDAAAVQAALF